jgi:hypothetical protein
MRSRNRKNLTNSLVSLAKFQTWPVIDLALITHLRVQYIFNPLCARLCNVGGMGLRFNCFRVSNLSLIQLFFSSLFLIRQARRNKINKYFTFGANTYIQIHNIIYFSSQKQEKCQQKELIPPRNTVFLVTDSP